MRISLLVTCPIVITLMLSCSHSRKFERDSWLANDDVNDTRNPRAYMKDELLKNYLHVGIPKDSILALLGKPYEDGIKQRLPKGFIVPDSVWTHTPENMKPENRDKSLKRFNDFMRLNSQPDTLMFYTVGWSTIDPNFLVIQLDDKGMVTAFWIEQH